MKLTEHSHSDESRVIEILGEDRVLNSDTVAIVAALHAAGVAGAAIDEDQVYDLSDDYPLVGEQRAAVERRGHDAMDHLMREWTPGWLDCAGMPHLATRLREASPGADLYAAEDEVYFALEGPVEAAVAPAWEAAADTSGPLTRAGWETLTMAALRSGIRWDYWSRQQGIAHYAVLLALRAGADVAVMERRLAASVRAFDPIS